MKRFKSIVHSKEHEEIEVKVKTKNQRIKIDWSSHNRSVTVIFYFFRLSKSTLFFSF